MKLADALPPAPQPLPGSPLISPSTPGATPNAQEFARRVSDGWCAPEIVGNAISATFQPDLEGLADLNALASLGGFDHFNIEQEITSISGAQAALQLPRWTGVDPALGGNTFYQFDDQFPWYYEEIETPYAWMPAYNDPGIFASDPSGQSTGLAWRDAPNLGPRNAGVTMEFTDYLVGIYPDHSGARISDLYPDAQNVNFAWTFRQGKWGKTPRDRVQFARFDKGARGARNAIKFRGNFGSDPTVVSLVQGKTCGNSASN